MPRWSNPNRRTPSKKLPAWCWNPSAGFDPHLAELAERVFAQGHLDSQVRKGKRGGAFCATPLHNVTPWVLLNYQGKADDVATLAHELGHAIHSMLAAHHTQFTFHSCLPLAETASTFGEMMLVDQLLAAGDENVAATYSSARWMIPMPPSNARPSLPCLNAGHTK